MNMIFDNSLWFGIGFVMAMLITAYVCWKDKCVMKKQHNEAMRLAKSELDAAESELIVKQNIINSLSAKIQRQQRTIDRQKSMLKDNDTRRKNNC